MKKFEIEVSRSYTTTIEVWMDDDLTTSDVKRIVTYDGLEEGEEKMYDEIWDILSEKELEQMDTDMVECKVKKL